MDSLTQLVLGAGIGELTMGRKIGNRAQLMGAIAGTIPDLDVLLSLVSKDPIFNLTSHRSYSHSIFVHIFLAIPFAYLSYYIFKKKHSLLSHYLLWFLGFATHALLDSCTTYGTQLLLPFTNFLVGFNNISIIDPLYTLPFMFLLIACLFYSKENPKRFKIAKLAFLVSCIYMVATFAFKFKAEKQFSNELKRQNIQYDKMTTSPTILNSFLWAGVAVNDSMIYSGEYSIFQKTDEIFFAKYSRNKDIKENHPAKRELAVMDWFSKGYNFVEEVQPDTLCYYNIKWGRGDFTKVKPEEAFIFYFKIIKDQEGKWSLKDADPKIKNIDVKTALKIIWDRIFNFDSEK